jgi:hypothetical protein
MEQNSATNATANGLLNQALTHHHVIQKRREQELPPKEPVKPKPVEEPLSPFQIVKDMVAEYSRSFLKCWSDKPDETEMAFELMVENFKRPPKPPGRHLDEETAHAMKLRDDGKSWKKIPYLVLDQKRAVLCSEREKLKRKAKAALHRRDNPKTAPRINGSPIS